MGLFERLVEAALTWMLILSSSSLVMLWLGCLRCAVLSAARLLPITITTRPLARSLSIYREMRGGN